MPPVECSRSIRHTGTSLVPAVILNFIFIEESSIVAIRPPKPSAEGFTLVELLVVLIITGIVMGLAIPSLLAVNKPLRDGTLQFKSHLSLIRSKAISTNQAYRIRPRYTTTAQYLPPNAQNSTLITPHNFIVESAANCQVTTYGTPLTGGNPGWQPANDLDLDLPAAVGVSPTPLPVMGSTALSSTFTMVPANGGSPISVTADPYLNWSICYDNRGVAYQPVSLTLKDFQGNNQAASARINVGVVGSAEIETKDRTGAVIPVDTQGNPVF